ncbi:MAG: FhlB domain-containing protein [Proteobacteria bacterium]|nr:FhlB domain-containing protein [Pseudomonadota bacterium]
MVANSDKDAEKQKKKAVALKYDREKDAAPQVAAKGAGFLAEKIIEVAQEHGIHIHEDADLVEVLEKVEVEQEIPLEVYSVVAEIFSYIYKVNKSKKA